MNEKEARSRPAVALYTEFKDKLFQNDTNKGAIISMLTQNTSEQGKALLDSVYAKIHQPEYMWPAMDELLDGLDHVRIMSHREDWENFSTQECPEHPLMQVIHQDPFTHRAFAKPRGYAGDAVTLDFIYQNHSIQPRLDETSEMGRRLYQYTSLTPACRSVRERRDIIAQMIDDIADTTPSPQILSLAYGHMDEAKYAKAVQNGKIDRYVAFDLDSRSLEVVEQQFAKFNVSCLHGNIKTLIKDATKLGDFDLIYALGLFDYLPQRMAQRLTNIMFSMLRPGGTILIGNFLPDSKGIGYTESFMAWNLIARNMQEMRDLAVEIPDSLSQKRVFTEKNQNIVLLEIRKTQT